MINAFLLLIILVAFFFITVKRAFYYLSFWAIATSFTAQLLLFVTSGQNEIRRKKYMLNLKVSQKYKGKLVWKWGIALYITGWALTCASLSSFLAIVSDDQICETSLKFGFEIWRSMIITMSVFVTPVVLVIELIFNRIPVKLLHILFPIGYFVAYVGLSAFMSTQMKEPIYGTNLNYGSFNPHKDKENNTPSVFNWEAQFIRNEEIEIGVSRIEFCRRHFKEQSEIFMTQSNEVLIDPDWARNGITLGVMFGALVIGHLLLCLISTCIKKDHLQPIMMQRKEEVRETLDVIENQHNA